MKNHFSKILKKTKNDQELFNYCLDVLNKETVKHMGVENPLGMIIRHGDHEGQVIGITEDFNFRHLSRGVDPLIFRVVPNYLRHVAVKLSGTNVKQTVDEIEDTWAGLFPDEPFEYHFLDEDFEKLYRAEIRMGNLFLSFSILAILIFCLGLLGMAFLVTEQRNKEIGIRKTMGASKTNIIYLLLFDFVKWILIANVIAWPIAWFYMQNWLQDYAFKNYFYWQALSLCSLP